MLAPVVAFAVTAAAVPLSIVAARRFGVLDAPTDRFAATPIEKLAPSHSATAMMWIANRRL